MNNFSYFNTTATSGKDLDKYEGKAKSQEDRIMQYFNDYQPKVILMTPSEALRSVFHDQVPITSVRRALSNLTRDGMLVKAGQVMGPYGRPEALWKLPTTQLRLL